jgi:hypothetical protein
MAKKKLTEKDLKAKAHDLAVKTIELEVLVAKNKEKRTAMKGKESELFEEIASLATEVESGEVEIDDQTDAFKDTGNDDP